MSEFPLHWDFMRIQSAVIYLLISSLTIVMGHNLTAHHHHEIDVVQQVHNHDHGHAHGTTNVGEAEHDHRESGSHNHNPWIQFLAKLPSGVQNQVSIVSQLPKEGLDSGFNPSLNPFLHTQVATWIDVYKLQYDPPDWIPISSAIRNLPIGLRAPPLYFI